MRVTKEIVRIWVIGAVAIVLCAVAITSIVLASQSVTFGLDLNIENIAWIDVSWQAEREDGTTTLETRNLQTDWRAQRPSQGIVMDEIMQGLRSGGRTNQLNQLFQSGGTQTVNRAHATTIDTIQRASDRNYIRIRFNNQNPQWGIIDGPTSGTFEIVPFGELPDNLQASRGILQIIVPLGNVSNGFTSQTWYLSTRTDTSTMNYRLDTWGNYYSLANFVRNIELNH